MLATYMLDTRMLVIGKKRNEVQYEEAKDGPGKGCYWRMVLG